MNFCSRFSGERKRLFRSQDEAATACGVTREMWGKYERGVSMPGAEVLAAFAQAGADIHLILTGQRIVAEPPAAYGPLPLKPDEAALLDNYRHSPPEAQAALRATSAALAKYETGMKATTGKGKI